MSEGQFHPDLNHESDPKKRLITIPDEATLLRRLLSIDDNPTLQSDLYPLILKDAGKESDASRVVMSLGMFLQTYVNYSESLTPEKRFEVYQKSDQYLDALIDDPEVAQAAKKMAVVPTEPRKTPRSRTSAIHDLLNKFRRK